jgi:hypothetical protein
MEQSELVLLSEIFNSQVVEKLIASLNTYKNGGVSIMNSQNKREFIEKERIKSTYDFLYTVLQNLFV